MIRSKHYIILLLLLISWRATAQDTKKTLQLYFKDVRSGKHPSISKQLSLRENAKAILSALPHTVTAIRAKAFLLTSLKCHNNEIQN
jgi:hypothetical protein